MLPKDVYFVSLPCDYGLMRCYFFFLISHLKKNLSKQMVYKRDGLALEAAKAQTDVFLPHCLSSAPFPLLCHRECFSDPLSHTWGRLPHSKRAQTGQTNQIPGILVCQQLSGNLFLLSESARMEIEVCFLMFFSGQFQVSFRMIKIVTLGEGVGGRIAIVEDNNCNDRRWW